MAKGRKTGGRARGTPNKRTIALQAAMRRAAEGLAADYTSLDLFQATYRNPDLPPNLRLYAASQAIPYEHERKPQGVRHTGADDGPIQHKIVDLAADEFDRKLADFLERKRASGVSGDTDAGGEGS